MFSKIKTPLLLLSLTIASTTSLHGTAKETGHYFKRIATFPVYTNLNTHQGDNLEDETSAEIATASEDGQVVYYSNSPKSRIGIIHIQNPATPEPAGFIQLDGEPTSVASSGHFLLVGINTSNSFTTPSGKLSIYSIENPLQPEWVRDFDMMGQPDSIAVSPDGQYAAVVIENERDEDFNDGLIPQLPAGFLMAVQLSGHPDNWKIKPVSLSGYASIAANDPEPEFVAINRYNTAAITLQENNHIVLVDLPNAKVIQNFSAGSADLLKIDVTEDGIINPVDSLLNRKREPDAISWIEDKWIATANEGDYKDENGVAGGSRGYTIFNQAGQVQYESGSAMEHNIIRAGHYPESRSENKGNEPETIIHSQYGKDSLLFVGSERANLVAIYQTGHRHRPRLKQLLPTGIAPEGILTIPERNLLVVPSEADSAEDGFRATVSIYQYGARQPAYPQIQSDSHQLISWGALSGMTGDQKHEHRAYAVHDSYYATPTLYTINTQNQPAIINQSATIQKDGNPVDYDLEGITQRTDGSFWAVSEGKSGTRENLLIHMDASGNVLKEITLPESVADKARNHGFEGVAVTGEGHQEKVLVAFQRPWNDDPAEFTRIGVYTPSDASWGFLYYPLDITDKGWVGLSEISTINDQEFMVIERDNQQGEQAKIKRLYRFSIESIVPAEEGATFPILNKTLVKDLLPELKAGNGWVVDKIEGTAISRKGQVFVVSDNDGVDDATGETVFLRLGKLLKNP